MPATPRSGWMLAAALLVALGGGGSALGRDLEQDDVLRLREQGAVLPLEQLLQRAFARHPGARLLEVELEEEDGVLVYELELVVAGGTVRELEFDAADGRLLKDEED